MIKTKEDKPRCFTGTSFLILKLLFQKEYISVAETSRFISFAFIIYENFFL